MSIILYQQGPHKELLTGTVPVNNLFHFLALFLCLREVDKSSKLYTICSLLKISSRSNSILITFKYFELLAQETNFKKF